MTPKLKIANRISLFIDKIWNKYIVYYSDFRLGLVAKMAIDDIKQSKKQTYDEVISRHKKTPIIFGALVYYD